MFPVFRRFPVFNMVARRCVAMCMWWTIVAAQNVVLEMQVRREVYAGSPIDVTVANRTTTLPSNLGVLWTSP